MNTLPPVLMSLVLTTKPFSGYTVAPPSESTIGFPSGPTWPASAGGPIDSKSFVSSGETYPVSRAVYISAIYSAVKFSKPGGAGPFYPAPGLFVASFAYGLKLELAAP